MNYDLLTRREPWRNHSRADQSAMQRTALAVIPKENFDDSDSSFFLRPEAETLLSDGELAALDSIIEKHGLKNLLTCIIQLAESRVDEALLQNGQVIYHLARESAWSYAAERLSAVAADERVRSL